VCAARRPPLAAAGNVHCMGVVRRRSGGWSWDDVEPREYASGAERHTLIGAAEGARDVELRYFRIPAGGASALESHAHEHAILILHGRADVLLGEEVTEAGPGDAVFVASQEPHRLTALGDEPLGFLCTALVDRHPKGGP
jgi:quercetin dioxygenase-like cupin family protein